MSHDYITVVLKLPKDSASRKKVVDAFPIGKEFDGAKITALSLEDEITVNEFLENSVAADVVDDARKATRELHQRVADAEA